MAMKRFCRFLADEYHLQKLSNISSKHLVAYVLWMQEKELSASTIKTDLAAIRFFHDSMPHTREKLPSNDALDLKRRTFGGVDRTWTMQEYNLMQSQAMMTGHKDYVAILSLARYAGLRLEECFRIDTNDARKALERTQRWLKRCYDYHKNDNQMLFPIVQGNFYADLRLKSLKEIQPFDMFPNTAEVETFVVLKRK